MGYGSSAATRLRSRSQHVVRVNIQLILHIPRHPRHREDFAERGVQERGAGGLQLEVVAVVVLEPEDRALRGAEEANGWGAGLALGLLAQGVLEAGGELVSELLGGLLLLAAHNQPREALERRVAVLAAELEFVLGKGQEIVAGGVDDARMLRREGLDHDAPAARSAA